MIKKRKIKEMFKIGMKVVCVVTFAFKNTYHDVTFPENGQVLTIRTVEEDGDTYLRFNEIKNPIKKYGNGVDEVQFWSKFFVPLLSDFKRITFSEVVEMVEVGEN